jgi:toxin YoeB
MGKYLIEYTETAVKELMKHKKAGNKSTLEKISRIILELENHPYTGIGQPEQLKHSLKGFWSRRINQKDRIVYCVEEDKVIVEVVSAMGHYSDK